MSRTIAMFASMVAAMLLTYGVALASPADLDSGFDEDGKVFTAFAPPGESRDESAQDVVVQVDGKILAAGFAQTGDHTEIALVRHDSDGSLDDSFGVGGKVTTDVVVGASEKAAALALAPDGKIVVGGFSDNNYSGVLVRYNPDGSTDASFDDDGRVVDTDVSSEITDLAVQGDGRIVVSTLSVDGNFALRRHDVDGSLDSSFGEGGRVTTEVGRPGYAVGTALGIQPDGKILLAGRGNGPDSLDFALVRYNPEGSLDSSFGENGKILDRVTQSYDYINDLALQRDGKIVAVGNYYSDAVLVRYDSNGSRDASFGNGGEQYGNHSGFRSVAIQPDGGIVTQSGSRLARYKPDGSPDPSLQYNNSDDNLTGQEGLALQADGKIVQAGTSNSTDGSTDFVLSRHLGGSDDSTPPETTILSGPKAASREIEALFRSSSSEPDSGFECSLDDAAFGPCNLEERYYSLSQGTHNFQVRATDAAGNTDLSPAQHTWAVDTLKPRGKVLINRDHKTTAARTVTLKLGVSDPSPGSGVVSMRLKNHGGSWTAWRPYATSKSWTLTAGAGTKTVYAQYRDGAGNVSAIVRDAIVYRP